MKIITHIISIFFALLFTFIIAYFFKDTAVKFYKNKSFLSENNKSPVKNLQNDLENGIITIFGSSDLRRLHQKFIPQNFFKNELNLPFRAVGEAFHTPFMMFSELATCESERVKNNAKVVIIVSPTWFSWKSYQEGAKLPVFLKYMPPRMVYKLFTESPADDKYREFVSSYINNHSRDMTYSSLIYGYAKYYKSSTAKKIIKYLKDEKIASSNHFNKGDPYNYVKPTLNYSALESEAIDIEKKKKTNNTLGLEDKFYTKNKKDFPMLLPKPKPKENNVIFKDLQVLLELLKTYKNKPLFIFADINPYVYKNKHVVKPIFNEAMDEVKKYGYGYLKLYSNTKEEFDSNILEDAQHFGEAGWSKINRKIIEHFMGGKSK